MFLTVQISKNAFLSSLDEDQDVFQDEDGWLPILNAKRNVLITASLGVYTLVGMNGIIEQVDI